MLVAQVAEVSESQKKAAIVVIHIVESRCLQDVWSEEQIEQGEQGSELANKHRHLFHKMNIKYNIKRIKHLKTDYYRLSLLFL
ncbi:MAG TPA: hypothetical protein VFV43_11660 [Limnobacter sp.]|nr:hypothetical protein [Limnobacter sp.]